MRYLLLLITLVLAGCAIDYPPYQNVEHLQRGMTLEQVDVALGNVRPSRLRHVETSAAGYEVYYQYLSDPNNAMNEQVYFFVFDTQGTLIRWVNRDEFFPKYESLDAWLEDTF